MADNAEALKAEPEAQTVTAEEKKPPETAAGGDGTANGTGTGTGEGEGGVAGDGAGDGESKPAELRMDQFNFGDEKKKKKSKKAKAKPPRRPSKPEYEQTITDLHAVLAQLRRKAVKLDEVNYEHNKKLVEAHAMDKDVSEHLQRVQRKRKESVIFEENYQLEIIKKRKDLEVESKSRILELQKEFATVEKQFLGEIEMLNYKFRSLCTFVDGGNETLDKMSNMENEYKESDRKFRDRLYEMQKKNVIIRKNTDDEAKRRFQRIIDDFTCSREVRNAAYTRRLLSENSDLRRMYNKLIPINLKKERELTEVMEKTSVVKETHTVLQDITKRLESTQIKREELLKKLKKSYNFYKLQVVAGSKYRRMFDAVKEYEFQESLKLQNKDVLLEDIAEHTAALHEKYRALKEAENQYLYQRHLYDLFVDSVREATFALCDLDEYKNMFPRSFDEYVAKRNGIVRGLIELITNTDVPPNSCAMLKAKYCKGYLGFMPLDFAVCQMLKETCCKTDCDLKWVPSYCQRAMQYVPKEEIPEESPPSDPAMQCIRK